MRLASIVTLAAATVVVAVPMPMPTPVCTHCSHELSKANVATAWNSVRDNGKKSAGKPHRPGGWRRFCL